MTFSVNVFFVDYLNTFVYNKYSILTVSDFPIQYCGNLHDFPSVVK